MKAEPAKDQEVIWFEAGKDAWMGLLLWGSFALIIGASFVPFFTDPRALPFLLLNIPAAGLLIWLWFGTHYRIAGNLVYYQSAFVKGEIDILTVRRVILNKYLWVGIRPALSTKGMVLEYGKYDELYIAPADREGFCAELKRINPAIEILEHKKE